MSNFYEYWIGKDINLSEIWNSFEEGQGYINKYNTMNVHLFQLTFNQPNSALPLFSHEVVFKTIKAYFHELKYKCFSQIDYDNSGPLFLYQVSRGSSKYEWIGELRQLLLMGTTLSDQKIIGQQIDNYDKKIEFLKKHFDINSIKKEDFIGFMNAETSPQMKEAINKLFSMGINSIKISEKPFVGDYKNTSGTYIDIKI